MELSFQTTPLHYLQRIVHEVRHQEETGEMIVPDSCPDVASIADCYANTILRGKDCRGGSVTISGGIKAGVFYTPEDNPAPRLLEFYLPFTVKFEDDRLTEHAKVIASARVCAVDARMINSRKVMLRVNLGCEISAYEEMEEELHSLLTQDRRLQLKTTVLPVSLPVEMEECSFVIRDAVELPAGKPAAVQMCKTQCYLELLDQKLVGNKAVFKGMLNCKILYCSEDGRLQIWQQQLPFSQYCELQRDYEDEELMILPVVTGYDLETEAGGEGRRFMLTVNILAQCLISGIHEMELVEDAYCVRGNLKPVWKQYQMEGRLDRQSSQHQIRQQISGSLSEVLDTEVYPGYPALRRDGDETEITLPVFFRINGQDENGRLVSLQGRGQQQMTLDLAEKADCCVYVQSDGSCFTQLMSDGAEVRCTLSLDTVSSAMQERKTLCGGEIEEMAKIGDRQPSVVLRSVGKDEELWNIAKQCGATTEAIRLANHMAMDRTDEECMLLIPIG